MAASAANRFVTGAPSSIHALPVLSDNIIWIWVRGDRAVVIDPALAKPVQNWLQARGLALEAILQTHHHSDHIGGTLKLLMEWPNASVIAASADHKRIPFQTISVVDSDQINLLGRPVEIIDVAAHTRAHVAYYLPPEQNDGVQGSLFCGDTLFGAGCGRLFEGSAADMHRALQRLDSLPAATLIYCAHEYTESNLRWAHSVAPHDEAIKTRLNQVIKTRKQGQLSIPTNLALERQTNLFLKAKTVEELSKLRLHKDQW